MEPGEIEIQQNNLSMFTKRNLENRNKLYEATNNWLILADDIHESK